MNRAIVLLICIIIARLYIRSREHPYRSNVPKWEHQISVKEFFLSSGYSLSYVLIIIEENKCFTNISIFNAFGGK
jgi:hypothetical protein